MKKIDVDFAVVVYNNFEDTYSLCKSLSSQQSSDFTSFRCFVVDNSDQPEISNSLVKLESEFDFVFYLKTPSNLGYFGAFNYLFESASFEDSSYVVLCNNDLVFSNDFLYSLCNINPPSNCQVICPNVIAMDARGQNPHVLSRYPFHKRLLLDLYFTNYLIARMLSRLKLTFNIITKCFRKSEPLFSCAVPTEIHMGIGACYVLTKDFLKSHNKLIYPHFLYGEEAYLTKQVHDSGGKLFYYSNLVVHHLESATLSKLPKKITYDYARDGYWSYRSFY